MKLKEKMSNLKDKFKFLFSKYPITLLAICFGTIFAMLVVNDVINLKYNTIKSIFASTITIAVGSFAIGVYAEKKPTKVLLNIINIAIAIAFGALLINFQNTLNSLVMRIIICYNLTCFLLGVYKIIKNLEVSLSEYILKVTINLLKATIIYGILALGILAIIYVLDILMSTHFSRHLLSYLEIGLVGFFYIPQCLNSLLNIDKEVENFFKIITKNVLMPLLIITFIIIYAYITKILVLKNMPKNQVFMILSVLFVIGFFIWTVMQYFKDDGIMYKISTKIPYVFIPFIILQIIAMNIRVSKFGLTPTRYMGYVLIIFEIIYLLMYLFKKEKISNIIIVANIIIILAVLVPFVNMYDVTEAWELNILKQYNPNVELSDNEITKIRGAYYYLTSNNSKKANKYMEENLSAKDIAIIQNSSAYTVDENIDYSENTSLNNSNKNDTISFDYNNSTEMTVNVEGYKIMHKTIFANKEYESNTIDLNTAFTNLTFYEIQDNNEITIIKNVNIQKQIMDYINKSQNEYNPTLEKEIVLNENQKLIINELNIKTDKKLEKCYYFYIYAVLLEK